MGGGFRACPDRRLPVSPRCIRWRRSGATARYLADFLKALGGPAGRLAGAAYLHNAVSEAAVASLYALSTGPRGRLFTGARRSNLLSFCKTASTLAPVARRTPIC